MDWIVKFGGGGETHFTPFALVVIGLAIVLILVLPRKYVLLPFFTVGLLLPMAQEAVLAGLHFQPIRILLLPLVIRMGVQSFSGKKKFRMTPIDKIFIAFLASYTVIFFILWGQAAALINRLGVDYTLLGVYFGVRLFIDDEEDVYRVARVFALICLVFGFFMLIEQHTGRNFFSTFGGIPQFSDVRDGKIRAQASFENSISAGIFGATLFPLFVGLWWRKSGAKFFALIGMAGSALMTLASSSATPIATFAAGIVALLVWPLRDQMRWIRRGLLAMVLGLQIVMKGPVWSLIERVPIVAGQSGYHRYVLIDGFIRHFFDWWLIGVRSTVGWSYFSFDTANQYVYVGVNGGLLTFVLFLSIIVFCFKGLGYARQAVTGDRGRQKFIWALGCALLAHMAAFIGLSYFDQTLTQLYALFALIACVAAPFWKTAQEPQASQLAPVPAPGWAGVRSRPELETENAVEAKPTALWRTKVLPR